MVSKNKDHRLGPRLVLVLGIFIFGVTSAMTTQNNGGGVIDPSPAWSKVAIPGPSSEGEIYDIAKGESRYVAVGKVGQGAAVWVSSDGLSWSRLPLDTDVFDPSNSMLTTVVAGGPGFVAIGRRDFEVGAWTSSDGMVWELVPNPLHDNWNSYVSDILATDFGLLAVGNVQENLTFNAAIWVSEDAQAWFWYPRIVIDDPSTSVRDVTPTNDFIAENGGPRFVAVGADSGPAIWTSVDGNNWDRLQLGASDDLGSYGLEATMVIGRAIYVAGRQVSSFGGDAAMWISLDKGATWERLTDRDPENAPQFEGPHWITVLQETDAFGFNELAFGMTWPADSNLADSVGTAWRGATGFPRWRRWSNTEFPAVADRQRINAAVSTEDLIIAVGRGAGNTPAIWTYSVPPGS